MAKPVQRAKRADGEEAKLESDDVVLIQNAVDSYIGKQTALLTRFAIILSVLLAGLGLGSYWLIPAWFGQNIKEATTTTATEVASMEAKAAARISASELKELMIALLDAGISKARVEAVASGTKAGEAAGRNTAQTIAAEAARNEAKNEAARIVTGDIAKKLLESGSVFVDAILDHPKFQPSIVRVANSIAIPAGTIIAYAGFLNDPPEGWAFCHGQWITPNQIENMPEAPGRYRVLFDALDGNPWGSGNGARRRLPDFRGQFLRGAHGHQKGDEGPRTRNAIDVGNQFTVGTLQMDHANPSGWSITRLPWASSGGDTYNARSGEGNRRFLIEERPEGQETRPKNAAVEWIIKY